MGNYARSLASPGWGGEMEIDLGVERLLGAERGDGKIAVEVKSFLARASAISEFHMALGQFINYRAACWF